MDFIVFIGGIFLIYFTFDKVVDFWGGVGNWFKNLKTKRYLEKLFKQDFER